MGVNKFKEQDQRSQCLLPIYQRLLEYIVSGFLFMYCTTERSLKSGTKDLALEFGEKGYDWLKPETLFK